MTIILLTISTLFSLISFSDILDVGAQKASESVQSESEPDWPRRFSDANPGTIHHVYLPLFMGGSTITPPPEPTPSPTPTITPEKTPSPTPSITPEPTAEPEGWKIIQLPGFGFYPSLALDSGGKPHIGYSTCGVSAGTNTSSWLNDDASRSECNIRYLRWDGNDWESHIIDTLSAGHDINPSLEIGPTDFPQIAYAYYNPARIGHAAWDGTMWQKSYLTGAMIPYYVSLALQANEDPCISYLNYSISAWSIRFTCRTGENWSVSRFVDNVTWTVWNPNFHFHSLALTANGTPHISYYRGIQDSTARLHHATLVGGTWEKTPVDGQGTGSYSSLALDSQNRPHISYHDHMNGDLKYARWDGSQWQVETIESSGIVGRFTSLALDGEDRPHISYIDATNKHLKYAFWDGNQWQIEAIDDSGHVWRWTSLALDDSGKVHISYVTLEGNKLGLIYATNSNFPGE